MTFDNIQNLYNKRVISEIQEIPTTIQITENKGYFIAEIKQKRLFKTTENETIKLSDKTEAKTEIITDMISFFDRIIKPFKNILNAKK